MIYFDNAATTKIDPRVLEKMLPYFNDFYGNPDGKYYDLAIESKKAINKARNTIASFFSVDQDEVFFNSGASEGNNTVLKGVINKNPNTTIISTKMEHSSIRQTLFYLQDKDKSIEFVKNDAKGRIDLDHLEKLLKKNSPALVSISYVNSEIGTIQDIVEIDDLCEKFDALLHLDATQAINKVRIKFSEIKSLKFLTFSAHKIHGPKGIGVLIKTKDKDGIHYKLPPLIHGGSQENGVRAGTSPVPLIVGVGYAIDILDRELEINISTIKKLTENLIEGLEKFPEQISINNIDFPRVPGIVNIRIIGQNNQILLKKASDFFAASTGSACSNTKPSYVLKAIGFTDKEIVESIRLSLSHFNSIQEINDFIKLL